MGEEQDSGYEVRARWGWARTGAVLAWGLVVAGLETRNPATAHLARGFRTSCGWNAAWWLCSCVADYVRLRRMGCLLRIDARGLTVNGGPTVPWDEVRKAEVGRGAVVFFSWGADKSLPLIPSGCLPSASDRRRRDRLTGRFGSPMVLPARLYGVRPAEVLSAVHTYDGRAALFR
jgi:hypothetical protein